MNGMRGNSSYMESKLYPLSAFKLLVRYIFLLYRDAVKMLFLDAIQLITSLQRGK